MDKTFLERFSSQYRWQVAPAKRRFRYRKQVNTGMGESRRLALTMRGVVDRSLDDRDGLQVSDYSTYQIFDQGDLAFKLIDLENIKTSRVGLVPRRGIMSPAYVRLVPNHGDANSRFYAWFFLAVYFNNIFNGLGGGVRQNLTPTDLLEFPIPLPDLVTQCRIADFLDRETAKIDLLIAKKKRLMVLLKQKRQAIVNDAVTPSTFLPPRRSSGIICESAEGYGGARVKLRRVASVRNKKSTFDNEFRPYVGLEHITPWTGEITASDDVQPEGLVAHFEKGDILFGKLRPYLAKVAAPEFRGVCSTEALVMKPGRRVETRFLQYSLLTQSFIGRVNAATYGAKMPRANWKTVGANSIYVPDLTTQRKIAELLDREIKRINLPIEKIMTSINRMKEYRFTMITAAVTGQIDVEICNKSTTRSRSVNAIQEEMDA